MSRHGLILLRENAASKSAASSLVRQQNIRGNYLYPTTTSRHHLTSLPARTPLHIDASWISAGNKRQDVEVRRGWPHYLLQRCLGLPTAVGVPGLRSSTPKHPSNFCKIIRLCLVGGSTRLRVCDSTRVGEHPARVRLCVSHTTQVPRGATRGFFTS